MNLHIRKVDSEEPNLKLRLKVIDNMHSQLSENSNTPQQRQGHMDHGLKKMPTVSDSEFCRL